MGMWDEIFSMLDGSNQCVRRLQTLSLYQLKILVKFIVFSYII